MRPDPKNFGEIYDPTPDQIDHLIHWDKRGSDLRAWILGDHSWVWPAIRGNHHEFLKTRPELQSIGIPLYITTNGDIDVTVTMAIYLTDPDWARQVENFPVRFIEVILKHRLWDSFPKRPHSIDLEVIPERS